METTIIDYDFRFAIASTLPYLTIALLIASIGLFIYSHKLSIGFKKLLPNVTLNILVLLFLLQILWYQEMHRSLRATFFENYKEKRIDVDEFEYDDVELKNFRPYPSYTTTTKNHKFIDDLIQWYIIFQLIGIPAIISKINRLTLSK